MDYSTISNKTTITEAEEFTGGELSEKYYLLRKQYDNLSINFETIKQDLHDSRRCYQTALDVQSHLSAELESYQSDEKRRLNEVNNRIVVLQEEISTLRQERSETVEKHAIEIRKLEVENKKLKEQHVVECSPAPECDNTELEETKSALGTVTDEMRVLKEVLEGARTEVLSWRMKVEELVTEVGELRAAAQIRKEELNAAGEREAAALADLAETRAMLHQIDSQDQQPHAAKGNSLFAEVEDKRQEMAKNLIHMKQTNARLRRDLANKQAELEALLHEKTTIWEQQAGAAAHDDKELMDAYAERITQLEGACERQRRELARWFARADAAPGWLPAVLQHLRTEVEQLRAEALARGAAELASAAQVRELRRKLALAAHTTHTTRSPPAHAWRPATGRPQPAADAGDTSVLKPALTKRSMDDIRKKVSFN